MTDPALILSLDFELHWGVRDHTPLERYRARLDGVSGITPDGWSVTWSEGKTPMLYVTKVK